MFRQPSFKIYYSNYKNSEVSSEFCPKLIGNFSADRKSEHPDYHLDLSQLKYFISPEDPNVHYDLDKYREFIILKHDKLNDILWWISKNFDLLRGPSSAQEPWLNVNFICHRRVLLKILCSPMCSTRSRGWLICALKYRGTIYLCEFYTDKKEQNNLQTTNGFTFEQYMLADDPTHQPDPSKPFNKRGTFHCVYRTEFGIHSLLYPAEIDGTSSKELITGDTLIGKNVELIELKVSPFWDKMKLQGQLRPDITVHWRYQNKLAKIDKLICGLKQNKKNVIKKLETYKNANEIMELSKVPCDLNHCKKFCKEFLDKVKEIVTKNYDECLYKFAFYPKFKKVHYSEENCSSDDYQKYFFLEQSFIDKAESYREENTSQSI